MSSNAASIPKAELHVHLEGTMNAEVIAALAIKNKLSNPKRYFDKEGHIIWHGFTQFIEMYDTLSEYIHTPEDLYHITYAYLEQSHQQGAIYSELTVSPQHAANVGISYETMLDVITAACQDARHAFGIESRLLMVLVRHEGEEACMRVLDQVVSEQNEWVVGIGLAGDERTHPARLFKKHFQKAKAHGLHLTAHAGEWGGAEQVREAIEVLGVTRIGHGVQSINDPKLMDEILERDIHLEVCPLSNLALEVYPDYQAHPIGEFVRLGVNFSLNSDDPPFFATNIGKEYETAMAQLALSRDDLLTITKNAIRSSFVSDSVKNTLLSKII